MIKVTEFEGELIDCNEGIFNGSCDEANRLGKGTILLSSGSEMFSFSQICYDGDKLLDTQVDFAE